MSKPLHVLVPSLSLPSRTPRTALSPARYPPVLSRLRRLALLTLALFSLARSQKLPRHYSAARSPFLDRFPSRQPLLALVFPFPPFFVRGTCSLLSPRFPAPLYRLSGWGRSYSLRLLRYTRTSSLVPHWTVGFPVSVRLPLLYLTTLRKRQLPKRWYSSVPKGAAPIERRLTPMHHSDAPEGQQLRALTSSEAGKFRFQISGQVN